MSPSTADNIARPTRSTGTAGTAGLAAPAAALSPAVALTARDATRHPAYQSPAYKSTLSRGPQQALIVLASRLGEPGVPIFGLDGLRDIDRDLTRNAIRNAEPLGERIRVVGRVLDESGRPVANTLVELWQANAAGRYVHKADQHDAPLDPNFLGAGRCLTDAQGRYEFLTIKPAAYPWGNHPNAWRPQHLHFSLFGQAMPCRLVTQMYFPGDPLLGFDPIYQSVPEQARDSLVARFCLDETREGHALGYVFDMVLRGAAR